MKLLKRFMAILFIFLILAFPIEQKVQADTATALATYETLAGITGVQPELAPITALAAAGLTCGLVYTNRDQLLAWGKYVKAQAILQGIDLSLVLVGNTVKMTSSFKTFLNNCVTSYQGTTLPTQTFNNAKMGASLPSNFYTNYYTYFNSPNSLVGLSPVFPTIAPTTGVSGSVEHLVLFQPGYGICWVSLPSVSGLKVYLDPNNNVWFNKPITYSFTTWSNASTSTFHYGFTITATYNQIYSGATVISSTVPIYYTSQNYAQGTYPNDVSNSTYVSSDTVTVPTTTASKSSVSNFADNDVITINPDSSLLNTGIGATSPMSSVLKDSAGVIPVNGNPSTTTTTTVDITPILNDAVNSVAGKIGGTVTKSDNLWKIITKSSTITITEEDTGEEVPVTGDSHLSQPVIDGANYLANKMGGSFFKQGNNWIFAIGTTQFIFKSYQQFSGEIDLFLEELGKPSNIMKMTELISDIQAWRATEAISKAPSLLNNYATVVKNGTKYGSGFKAQVASVAIDMTDTLKVGYGCNRIWANNPSIVSKTFNTTQEYVAFYRQTLTDSYIDKLVANNPAEFTGKDINSIKTEMSSLRSAIQHTKDLAAAKKEPIYFDNNPLEPTFESQWLVENCAEVWAVRDVIMQGAKYKNIVIRSVDVATGEIKPLCENCQRTFVDLVKAMQ